MISQLPAKMGPRLTQSSKDSLSTSNCKIWGLPHIGHWSPQGLSQSPTVHLPEPVLLFLVFCSFVTVQSPSWVSSFGSSLVRLLYPAEDGKSTLSHPPLQSPCILCDQGPLLGHIFTSSSPISSRSMVWAIPSLSPLLSTLALAYPLPCVPRTMQKLWRCSNTPTYLLLAPWCILQSPQGQTSPMLLECLPDSTPGWMPGLSYTWFIHVAPIWASS